MSTKRTVIFTFLMLMALGAGIAAERGSLLVESYGKRMLSGMDGVQRSLAPSIGLAALSPDGRNVAFTQNENPRELQSAQMLSIVPVGGGSARLIGQIPSGSHFESLGWMPDGNAVVFQGKGGHLFIAAIASGSAAPRDLGPWYQGFSVSPDGTKIVHAVNSPDMGLETLDVSSGKRTLIHKSSRIVWRATFSPDGQWIAYEATLRDPPRTKDDDPDCTPPTIGLRLYSIATKSDSAVTITTAPKDWDNVRSYAWSPDSKRLALTLGTTDCDYPGSANGVFIISLDRKSQMKASQGDMAFEPVFSPDGSSVAFVDFSDSPARLFRFDITTGARSLIQRATE